MLMPSIFAENALDALMFVLAIDAEKCSRNKRQNN